MHIVETQEEFDWFQPIFKYFGGIVVPIFTDPKVHPAVNKLSVVFVFCFNTIEWRWHKFALMFDHNDGDKLAPSLLTTLHTKEPIYTPSAKAFLHHWQGWSLVVDMTSVEFDETGIIADPQTFYTPTMRQMYTKFHWKGDINRAIPVLDLLKYAEAYTDHFHDGFRNVGVSFLETDFVQSCIIPACQFMETSGIHVDEDVFVKKFGQKGKEQIHNGLVYTEFNPYTSAGRVTSRFGGINYAALDKSDITRDAFTSRFGERGRMVLMDFESFHLRLIANLINFELPNEPVHEWLGKQYFQTDILTPEQYSEGKQFTFQSIYGGGKGVDIPFFREISKFIDKLWTEIQSKGVILTPSHRKIRLDRIEDPNPAKVFNYLLQAVETEVAMSSIYNLSTRFAETQSKVVLYTYDSILIDFCIDDGKELLSDTIVRLSQLGKYPVRAYAGTTYKNVKSIKLEDRLTPV